MPECDAKSRLKVYSALCIATATLGFHDPSSHQLASSPEVKRRNIANGHYPEPLSPLFPECVRSVSAQACSTPWSRRHGDRRKDGASTVSMVVSNVRSAAQPPPVELSARAVCQIRQNIFSSHGLTQSVPCTTILTYIPDTPRCSRPYRLQCRSTAITPL